MRTRLLIVIAALLPTIACDQATKNLAVEHLRGQGTIDVMRGVRLIYAENPGAFLGLFKNLPESLRFVLLSVGVSILLVGLAVAALKMRSDHPLAPAGIALLLAGGVGNLVDRLVRPGGRVVDFLQIGFGPVHTGIFNVADVAIVVGALCVLLASVLKKQEPTRAEATIPAA